MYLITQNDLDCMYQNILLGLDSFSQTENNTLKISRGAVHPAYYANATNDHIIQALTETHYPSLQCGQSPFCLAMLWRSKHFNIPHNLQCFV